MPSIILTRPSLDSERIAPLFSMRGFRVFSVPMIELLDVAPPADLIEQIRPSVAGSAVMVTSSHAALRWLDLRLGTFEGQVPGSYYVVGPHTAKVLEERDPLVPVRDIASNAVELALGIPSEVTTILYPCSAARRDEGVTLLEGRGVSVVELRLYRPGIPPNAGQLLDATLRGAGRPYVIAFFSPSAVDSFFSLHPGIPHGGIFAAIGITTADALARHGVTDVVVASTPSSEVMAEELGRRLLRNV